MKKILLVLLLLIPLTSSVFAYEEPNYSCYFEFNSDDLGDLTIYMPCSSDLAFSSLNGAPINIGSSTVTGYFTYQGEDYTVSFRPYQYGTYRITGFQTENLTGTYGLTNNFNFQSDGSIYLLQNWQTVTSVSIVFILVISLFFFLRSHYHL